MSLSPSLIYFLQKQIGDDDDTSDDDAHRDTDDDDVDSTTGTWESILNNDDTHDPRVDGGTNTPWDGIGDGVEAGAVADSALVLFMISTSSSTLITTCMCALTTEMVTHIVGDHGEHTHAHIRIHEQMMTAGLTRTRDWDKHTHTRERITDTHSYDMVTVMLMATHTVNSGIDDGNTRQHI